MKARILFVYFLLTIYLVSTTGVVLAHSVCNCSGEEKIEFFSDANSCGSCACEATQTSEVNPKFESECCFVKTIFEKVEESYSNQGNGLENNIAGCADIVFSGKTEVYSNYQSAENIQGESESPPPLSHKLIRQYHITYPSEIH